MSTTITDDYMRQMMTTTKPYTVVILTKGPNFNRPDAMGIIWEHGRKQITTWAGSSAPLIPLSKT